MAVTLEIWQWIAPVFKGYGVVFGLALLHPFLWITSDRPHRAQFNRMCEETATDWLLERYGSCLVVVAAYRQLRTRPVIHPRRARMCLICATVIREHLQIRAGLAPPKSYLRSRRELLRTADRLELTEAHLNALRHPRHRP